LTHLNQLAAERWAIHRRIQQPGALHQQNKPQNLLGMSREACSANEVMTMWGAARKVDVCFLSNEWTPQRSFTSGINCVEASGVSISKCSRDASALQWLRQQQHAAAAAAAAAASSSSSDGLKKLDGRTATY
jgi:hypothetical protein